VAVVHLYEITTGRRIWSIPSQQPPDDLGALLGFDPTGKVLALGLSRNNRAAVVGVSSNEVLGTLDPASAAVDPGAARWLASRYATRDQPAGWSLYQRGLRRPLITVALDHSAFSDPRFSPDGIHVAWGHPDGTVSVVDLDAVHHRLESIGLGW
jgi:hypothetical protein